MYYNTQELCSPEPVDQSRDLTVQGRLYERPRWQRNINYDLQHYCNRSKSSGTIASSLRTQHIKEQTLRPTVLQPNTCVQVEEPDDLSLRNKTTPRGFSSLESRRQNSERHTKEPEGYEDRIHCRDESWDVSTKVRWKDGRKTGDGEVGYKYKK